MTEPLQVQASRRALARRHGLIDLGRIPERIRIIANFWGGSTKDARAMYELAHCDGLVTSITELRSEMARVHDPNVRAELLAWLENCAR